MIIRKALSCGFYSGYKMGADEVEISLMQFADDTLFLDNPDHANVLCM